MKERHFWWAITFIGLSWIANSIYAQSKQLKEPIFLDHYIETSANHDIITFYYLANKNDQRHLNYFLINHLNAYLEDEFIYSQEQPYNMQSFRHHVLRSKTIHLNSMDLAYHSPDKDFSFTNLSAIFSDGTSVDASIGDVTIHSNDPFFSSDSLRMHSSSSSNSGESSYQFEAIEPITINEISYSFYERFKDDLLITSNLAGSPSSIPVDEMDFPIHLEKGQQFTIKITPYQNASIVHPVMFPISVSGFSQQGEAFVTSEWYVNQPYLTQQDVNAIIRKKARRDSD